MDSLGRLGLRKRRRGREWRWVDEKEKRNEERLEFIYVNRFYKILKQFYSLKHESNKFCKELWTFKAKGYCPRSKVSKNDTFYPMNLKSKITNNPLYSPKFTKRSFYVRTFGDFHSVNILRTLRRQQVVSKIKRSFFVFSFLLPQVNLSMIIPARTISGTSN